MTIVSYLKLRKMHGLNGNVGQPLDDKAMKTYICISQSFGATLIE